MANFMYEEPPGDKPIPQSRVSRQPFDTSFLGDVGILNDTVIKVPRRIENLSLLRIVHQIEMQVVCHALSLANVHVNYVIKNSEALIVEYHENGDKLYLIDGKKLLLFFKPLYGWIRLVISWESFIPKEQCGGKLIEFVDDEAEHSKTTEEATKLRV